jgi:hypothetical protein
MLRALFASAALLTISACSPAAPPTPNDGAVLTIYGEIGVVDRGAIDPLMEPLFTRYGIEFDAACSLNFSSLDAMDQRVIRADFPYGQEEHIFSGPLLRDALSISEMTGDTLVITALDGYQREIELSRIQEFDVILAIRMDGEVLGLGGMGPAVLVWPRQTDYRLTGMSDEDWLWGVFAIEVKQADTETSETENSEAPDSETPGSETE